MKVVFDVMMYWCVPTELCEELYGGDLPISAAVVNNVICNTPTNWTLQEFITLVLLLLFALG